MNNFEQPQTQEEVRTRVGNEMQIQLALLNGESIEEFIERHAKAFREEVTKHPEIFEEYQQKPTETLIKIKERIYH